MSKKKNKKGRKKKSEFPNNWAFYKKLKPKHFESPDFRDFVEGFVNHWELLPGVQLVARAHHLNSGKIEEHAFATPNEVRQFFKKISKSGEPYHVHCCESSQTFTAVFSTDD